MTEIHEGWQCIGCGKIDVDRPARNKLLESIVRRMALARPHPDAWERSYRALQAEAVQMLSEC